MSAESRERRSDDAGPLEVVVERLSQEVASLTAQVSSMSSKLDSLNSDLTTLTSRTGECFFPAEVSLSTFFLSSCLPVCLSVCLSVCQSVDLFSV